jgi:dTDP-4-amino-4,6-dideoxygalactose transaminase
MEKELLAILGGRKTLHVPGPHFRWPLITSTTRHAIISQLDESISIYNRSGIFKKFEDAFARYHGKKFALLSNSGTSSIFAMFEGLGFGPGDELIAPVYTFFATVSPLMQFGARPVFADCKSDGNIDPVEIEKKITSKTKAVIVTHMWGIPCDMNSIVEICKKNNLFLLEDCSHAHGAEYFGQKVGTFGHAAAWSLQGQKIVTGGEGGIMLTDEEEVYTRALLQGHYNKRCFEEISPRHHLYPYAHTGLGLKLRAHPLAVAMAYEQFQHLDDWLNQKRQFAELLITELSKIPFLKMPLLSNKKPSWYAFVINYDAKNTGGISREVFCKALKEEGLDEVDIPRSTCPLNNLSLFRMPQKALPRLYKPLTIPDEAFPNSDAFYNTAIKFPVWALPEDEPIVKAYIKGIIKVAEQIDALRAIEPKSHITCS